MSLPAVRPQAFVARFSVRPHPVLTRRQKVSTSAVGDPGDGKWPAPLSFTPRDLRNHIRFQLKYGLEIANKAMAEVEDVGPGGLNWR